MANFLKIFTKFILFLSVTAFLYSCGGGFFKKVDTRKVPISGPERAKKNVAEGRGVSLKGIRGGGKTSYEFSTSNPLWRASLEILDFLPLATVDYSGGLIISDWYSDSTDLNNSIKITVRFLTNEIQSNSVKVIVHKKFCKTQGSCTTKLITSKISEELTKSILVKAAELEAIDKKKKN